MYQYQPLSNEQTFEYLIKDIMYEEYNHNVSFDLYGKRGQKQYGNDILGYDNKKVVLAQVKKKDLKRYNLKNELLYELEEGIKSIAEHFKNHKIEKVIFASTYKRDVELQDKAAELSNKFGFTVIYWGWDTIEEKINLYSSIQSQYYPIKAKKELTIIPSDILCIGRESIIEQINCILHISQICLLQGIGGIGKSTLLAHYINGSKYQYNHIAFLSIDNDLESSLIHQLSNFMNVTSVYGLEDIIYKLQELDGDNLLVIDNLKNVSDFNKIQPLLNNFKILIASRNIFDIQAKSIVTLAPLELKFARKLFIQYFEDGEKDISSIDQIIQYLDFHPLFIELTAKSINENTFTLSYILNEFNNGHLPKINASIDLDTGEILCFNDYLLKLYLLTINELKDEYIKLLQRFSFMPSVAIDISRIENIFLHDHNIEIKLNFLCKKGWLIKIGKDYKMHQIIKEFLIANYPLQLEFYTDMIIGLLSKLEWNEIEHPNSQEQYMIYAQTLIDNSKTIDAGLAMLSNNLAMLIRYFGNYDEALKYMLITLQFDELTDNPYNLAQSYNNIGNIYHKLKDIDNTIKYFELSINIREQLDNPLLSESYLAMGSLLLENGYLDQAKSYFDILQDMNVPDKSYIPMTNFGILLFFNLEESEIVMKYINAALKFIETNIVDENHLYIAYTYHNISLVYEKLFQNFSKALDYKTKQLEVMRKNFDENHQDAKNIISDLQRLSVLIKTELLS